MSNVYEQLSEEHDRVTRAKHDAKRANACAVRGSVLAGVVAVIALVALGLAIGYAVTLTERVDGLDKAQETTPVLIADQLSVATVPVAWPGPGGLNMPCHPLDVVAPIAQRQRVKPMDDFAIILCVACSPAATLMGESSGRYDYLWGKARIQALNNTCYRIRMRTPSVVGLYHLSFVFDMVNVTREVDVTCSNGIFCDGAELYVNGKCIAGGRPCGLDNKGNANACRRYPCYESNQTCGPHPVGASCPLCDGGTACIPVCAGRTCGDDGCGGTCGTCNTATTDYCGVDGSCHVCACGVGEKCDSAGVCYVPAEGTCDNAYPLFVDTGVYTVVSSSVVVATNSSTVPTGAPFGAILRGSISTAQLDEVTPYCGLSGVQDVIYRFTLTATSGYNILASAADEGECVLDTLLAVHRYDTDAPAGRCLRDMSDVPTGSCADEGNPFAFCASRVYGLLEPGDYALVMTVYDATNSGDYLLNINFNNAPTRLECENVRCGNDVHGFPCVYQDGVCTNGSICLNARCELPLAECAENTGCDTRTCGPAPNCPTQLGCGPMQLSACANPHYECELSLGFCFDPALPCDSRVPMCTGAPPPGKGNSFCGSDCKWHLKNAVIADLVSVPLDRVRNGIQFLNQYFTPQSCTLLEGCTLAAGERQLMRFETSGVNQGLVSTFDVDEADYRINKFSQCHQHTHIKEFAEIVLLDPATNLAQTTGYKLGFCISDSEPFMTGADVPCEIRYDCDDQGVQFGWTDEYPSDLDCQWLDITSVARDKWYFFRQCINFGRVVVESTYENNCVLFPVWVPSFNSTAFIADYQGYLDEHPSIPPPPPLVPFYAP